MFNFALEYVCSRMFMIWKASSRLNENALKWRRQETPSWNKISNPINSFYIYFYVRLIRICKAQKSIQSNKYFQMVFWRISQSEKLKIFLFLMLIVHREAFKYATIEEGSYIYFWTYFGKKKSFICFKSIKISQIDSFKFLLCFTHWFISISIKNSVEFCTWMGQFDRKYL